MFGRGKDKLGPAEELYREQAERNPSHSQKYEYRTLLALGHDKFDIGLNEHAKVGWELVGFQINSSPGTSPMFYGALRRQIGS